MFGFLAAAASAVAGYLLTKKGGGGGLIPSQIDVDVSVDFWEKNKTLFILVFFAVAALIVSRL